MKKLTKVQTWGIIIGVLALWLGLMIGGSAKPKEITKEVIKEVPVTKEVIKEVVKEPDLTNWRALKSKDDEIISLAGDGFTTVAGIFQALSVGDAYTVNKLTDEMGDKTGTITILGNERKEILKKLGY